MEGHVAELDLAPQPPGLHGPDGLGHAGHAVEDGEDPLRAGPRPLHGRHHAAHRIHAAVEAADQRHESHELAHVALMPDDAPRAESPHDQQAQVGQQRDDGSEIGPLRVDAIVGLQHAMIGLLEPFDLAMLLGESLDHADAGDRVGQHAGHFAPSPLPQRETAAEPVPRPMDQIADQRQGNERHHRQPGSSRTAVPR